MSSESHTSKLPVKTKYEWNELNRAREAITFFEAVIQPSLERDGVALNVIDNLKLAFYSYILDIIAQKLAQTQAPINLEMAVKIIDEELPKLLKESSPSINVSGIISTWDFIKKVLTGEKNEQQKTERSSSSSSTNK